MEETTGSVSLSDQKAEQQQLPEYNVHIPETATSKRRKSHKAIEKPSRLVISTPTQEEMNNAGPLERKVIGTYTNVNLPDPEIETPVDEKATERLVKNFPTQFKFKSDGFRQNFQQKMAEMRQQEIDHRNAASQKGAVLTWVLVGAASLLTVYLGYRFFFARSSAKRSVELTTPEENLEL
jgi:hypothetical protein